jgi:hypothetical protein
MPIRNPSCQLNAGFDAGTVYPWCSVRGAVVVQQWGSARVTRLGPVAEDRLPKTGCQRPRVPTSPGAATACPSA